MAHWGVSRQKKKIIQNDGKVAKPDVRYLVRAWNESDEV